MEIDGFSLHIIEEISRVHGKIGTHQDCQSIHYI
ncbi:hypothetical protein Goshw_026695 [Gossypium schwendimanii]|uniref:Uncharacterized protein n=1 Tax=Gossypium schwendimanii TaxID=34291 RepID=A0A7J9KZ77_GOSSC|nr:hypothetical protein [Gossypium schwendimanii]